MIQSPSILLLVDFIQNLIVAISTMTNSKDQYERVGITISDMDCRMDCMFYSSESVLS